MNAPVHRQAHNGTFVICRHDGEQWPCPTVAAAASIIEGLSDRCQYVCPGCGEFVWMQVQSGEMWCPNGHCDYYGSQFDLLRMVFDPSLADVQMDIAELSEMYYSV